MCEVTVTVKSAANLPEDKEKRNPYVVVVVKGYRKRTTTKTNDLNPFWDETLIFQLKGEKIKSDDHVVFNVFSREKLKTDKLIGHVQAPIDKSATDVLEQEFELLDNNNELLKAQLIVSVEYKERDEEEEFDASTDHKPGLSLTKLGSVDPLSSKPEDLQLRVSIIKAQSLVGSRINPVARVDCCDISRQTRVLDNTNSPYWGETFFFNLFISLADLAHKTISFSVYNSRMLRQDALIGVFKCTLSFILEHEASSITNKWLLISDPDDMITAGAKGYLKVSVIVLRAGDVAPTSVEVMEDESDDVESNLLRPAGMQLRLATFHLRLLRGEDFPHEFQQGTFGLFSSAKSAPTNVCLLFKFAGIKSFSTMKFEQDNPEWNEELKFGLHWPSMCSGVCLRILDGDRKSSEESPIGTSFLRLSSISSDGLAGDRQGPEGDSDEIVKEGFLPTFGPTYVVFYGSPREMLRASEVFQELNRGIGEGVSYRGRILLELGLSLDACQGDRTVPISKEVLAKYQLFMRRRKFWLFCAFSCASMLSIHEEPVKFEVSMGNYGDFLCQNVPPSSSMTQTANPIYDGHHYFNLTWVHENPCCMLEVNWEDVTYRLFSINILLKICDRLASNIDKIRVAMKARLPDYDQAQLVIGALDELVLQCSKNCKFPRHDPNQVPETELDVRWRTIRQSVINFIKQDALNKREELTSVQEGYQTLEEYLKAMKALAFEAQVSIPDVFIWLICGENRIAYHRISAYDIIFSENYDWCGRYCSVPQTLFLKSIPSNEYTEGIVPGVIRCCLWFGDPSDASSWNKITTEGSLVRVAEVYENQVYLLGTWVSSGTISRPTWSDDSGEYALTKDDYVIPSGWQWDGDWYLSPPPPTLPFFDQASSAVTYVEEIYCNEVRTDDDTWVSAVPEFTDLNGEPCNTPDEVRCPAGWSWATEWQIDFKRACDNNGWEYSVDPAMRGYVPVMKNYHLCRRRRIVRTRTMPTQADSAVFEIKLDPDQCWEYATLFSTTARFHMNQKTLDLVRRRRWHRKIVPHDSKTPCVFRMATEKSGQDIAYQKSKVAAPKIFITIEEHHRWELRAYMYQARDLLASSDSGFSHPYARVIFDTYSDVTKSIEMSLSPLWDQTLILTGITLGKTVNQIHDHPPHVIVEIFDLDLLLEDRMIGRCCVSPMVKIDSDDTRRPILQWHDLTLEDNPAGKLLAAFELILVDSGVAPMVPERRGAIYSVPSVIRPFLRRTGIEIVCWGLRKLGQFQLASIDCPDVEFEMGGYSCQSDKLWDAAKNPNFTEPWLFLDAMLPKEELYMPPLNVRMRDRRSFGRTPIVGSFAITELDQYVTKIQSEGEVELPFIATGFAEVLMQKSITEDDLPLPLLHARQKSQMLHKKITAKKKDLSTTEINQVDEDFDWWSKYYASMANIERCPRYATLGYDQLILYEMELEKAYNNFQDLLHNYTFRSGSNVDDNTHCEEVGEFKGAFKIYPLPEDPSEPLPEPMMKNALPPSTLTDCTVRVYILRAYSLQPTDPQSLADAYLRLCNGKKVVETRDEYIPNSLDPTFGKMYEMNFKLPVEKELRIEVMDRDLVLSDELIGATVVDLENRFLSRHRATVGLPKSYCTTGTNFWRDNQLPTHILKDLCDKYNLSYFEMPADEPADICIEVGAWQFRLNQFEAPDYVNVHWGLPIERLALHILNTMPLLKEHVEMRSLYTPLQPGIEQGKLQMWVDIFPLHLGDPGPAVDISPRVPRKYVLRVVIYNTYGIKEYKKSEDLIDLYVRGYITGIEAAQDTDVHYRSIKGDGNFNWRFVFPFEYLPSEEVVVVKTKANFWSVDVTERRVPPKLVIQVYDNDFFGPDDVLGTLDLPLRKMIVSAKNTKKVKLKNRKTFNLFESRRCCGFWPYTWHDPEIDAEVLVGSIEMELEILTEEEAEKRPAGRARDDPNSNPFLENPKRPDTSFLWFTSPWKTFRYIIWRRHKWTIVGTTVVGMLTAALMIFFYTFPGELSKKILN